MTVRDSMMAVYRNQRPDRVPVGIYGRYLPRGSCERLARQSGVGLIESYPLVSLLAPPWHLFSGYLSEVKAAQLRVEYTWHEQWLATLLAETGRTVPWMLQFSEDIPPDHWQRVVSLVGRYMAEHAKLDA